ncbi:MAG: polymer-forming cytoskeletal protein [Magnetospirillum gryphiswaldense]|nr:polymer-forming cytoskeletal protein [Magnetospirillum gryphiswaldense]
MLRKLGKSSDTAAAAPLSIIGADVRIVGDIITDGEMQIDGHVEGDISCKTLVIGPKAHIVGEVRAHTIRIHGEVSGRLAADHVTIGRSGRVTGDICHGSLEIQSGAQVEGHFLRKEAQAEPVALPKPEAKPVNDKAEKAVTVAQPPAPEPQAKPANGKSEETVVTPPTPESDTSPATIN